MNLLEQTTEQDALVKNIQHAGVGMGCAVVVGLGEKQIR